MLLTINSYNYVTTNKYVHLSLIFYTALQAMTYLSALEFIPLFINATFTATFAFISSLGAPLPPYMAKTTFGLPRKQSQRFFNHANIDRLMKSWAKRHGWIVSIAERLPNVELGWVSPECKRVKIKVMLDVGSKTVIQMGDLREENLYADWSKQRDGERWHRRERKVFSVTTI